MPYDLVAIVVYFSLFLYSYLIVKEKVLAEEHLKVPFSTNKKVATLIKDCRSLKPSSRPDFDYISGVLKGVLS